MTKKFTFFLLMLCFFHACHAQTVSSCTAPDSIVKKYVNDADYLALQRVLASGNNYKDSVTIPQIWTDTSLRALLAVYNVVGIPARDSVVKMYPVHIHRSTALKDFSIGAAPTEPWMVQLKNSTIPTGNTVLDNLITKYHLHLGNYITAGVGGTHTVEFYSDSNYNVPKMQSEFMGVSGVANFAPGTPSGTGSYILDTVTSTYVALSCWYGWGDCLSGCLFYHYWNFRIAYDCKVTYMGSGGSKLDPVRIAEVPTDLSTTVYPNPATDEVHITIKYDAYSLAKVVITDITGRVIYSMPLTQLSMSDHTVTVPVQNLLPGTYFYRVVNEQGPVIANGKIIKQ